MKPSLEILPVRHGSAAENMATDFLLLQRYPRAAAPRLRHYGWQRPAFTFGYSQKIAFVRTVLPPADVFDLCRRPTGGGVVDHRDDWTYALVIPRGHPLEEVRAIESYRAIHESLAEALRQQGVPATTKKTEMERAAPSALVGRPGEQHRVTSGDASAPAGPGVCFDHAELFDVIHEPTGRKIAGAAQKRNKHGLLFQGSLWRPSVEQSLDDDRLLAEFTDLLARALGLSAGSVAWPDLNEEELSGLTEQYSSPEWIEWR